MKKRAGRAAMGRVVVVRRALDALPTAVNVERFVQVSVVNTEKYAATVCVKTEKRARIVRRIVAHVCFQDPTAGALHPPEGR